MQYNEEGGGLEPVRKAGDGAIHIERIIAEIAADA